MPDRRYLHTGDEVTIINLKFGFNAHARFTSSMTSYGAPVLQFENSKVSGQYIEVRKDDLETIIEYVDPVLKAARQIILDWSPPVAKQTHFCRCDIHLLMREGCKCGHIAWERSRAG